MTTFFPQVVFMYVPELFPTMVRTKGFAMVTLAGSLGQCVAPIVTDLLVREKRCGVSRDRWGHWRHIGRKRDRCIDKERQNYGTGGGNGDIGRKRDRYIDKKRDREPWDRWGI